jgi:serpin B
MTRRDVLRALALTPVGAALALPLAGCGTAGDEGSSAGAGPGSAGLALSKASRSRGSQAALPDAVTSVQALTGDLFMRLAAAGTDNLVCSPYSVAMALAMTRNGAAGTTATEMDAVLHAPALGALNGGLNSLAQLLDKRAGRKTRADGSRGLVSLDVANSLWGQRGTTWQPAFLDALARDYGAGMRLVDYKRDAAGATELINDWTAAATHDKIPDIIPPGLLSALTRLVLVNAIYLKAPWEEPFEPVLTSRKPFHKTDGSTVQAETMAATLKEAAFASGPGWQAGRLGYAGGELAMAVVLPDPGRLEEVQASMDGPMLGKLLTSFQPVASMRIELPRFTFRARFGLDDQLIALGMPTAFDPVRADFSGMTDQAQLYISAVLHQAFIAVDEHGTEAAAATAVVLDTTSLPANQVVLKADRPFLFVLFDVETSAPLFIGRVSDPTV